MSIELVLLTHARYPMNIHDERFCQNLPKNIKNLRIRIRVRIRVRVRIMVRVRVRVRVCLIKIIKIIFR